MGVRFPSVASNVIIASPAAAAETIIATTGPINEPVDNAQVLIFFYLLILIGTAGTAVGVNLRRGATLGGTLVNLSFGISTSAGSTEVLAGCYPDNPGIVAGLQYTMTATVTAATGASTVRDLALVAMVL